jgi:hypothetical protein
MQCGSFTKPERILTPVWVLLKRCPHLELSVKRFIASGLVVVIGVVAVRSQTAVNVQIDVAASRHPIDPRI